MAGTTTRKQTRNRADTPERQSTPAPVNPETRRQGEESATTDVNAVKVEALRTAYHAAIQARDPQSGTVPDDHLKAVSDAYVAVSKRDRGETTAVLNAESMASMMRDDGTVDTALVNATATLAKVFTDLYNERVSVPRDPVPGIAGVLAALRAAPEELLGSLTVEQRNRIETIDLATNDEARATHEATQAALQKVSNRVLNGRRRTNGATGPARSLPPIIRQALTDVEGDTVTLNQVARDHNISTGALKNRWDKDNVDGVRCVTDSNGHRAFKLA